MIEPLRKREEELRAAFWDQIKGIPRGDKIQNCIQCGTCTGTCPVSYMMDITPRETVALFRAGHLEDILHSRTIWICASCYSCRVRCPSGILVTDLMYALKRLAMSKKIYPPKFPVYALSRTFISILYRYGRNYELGLAIIYFLRTSIKKMFTNISFGFNMIKKSRISLLPHSIQKIGEVRKIIDKAYELDKRGL